MGFFDAISQLDGGGRGIRTPVTLSGKAVFKTACFNHSHIPPRVAVHLHDSDAAGESKKVTRERIRDAGAHGRDHLAPIPVLKLNSVRLY